MKCVIKTCGKYRRFIATMVLLLVVLLTAFGSGSSFISKAEDASSISLFDKSAIISTAMEQGWLDTLKQNLTDNDWDIAGRIYEGNGHADSGNGGAYMGFAQDTDGKVLSSIKSLVSQNNQTVSYNSIQGAMYGYSMYGYILNYLNLYETTSSASMSFDFNRVILGNLLKVIFNLYQVVPSVFGMVASFMQATNPFALFMIPIEGVVAIGQEHVFYPLASLVKNLYDSVQELGIFVVLPVMIALATFTAVMSKNTGAMKNKFFKIVIRTGIIVIGVPLIGSFYSSAINGMSTIPGQDGIASRVVASTLFDFEAWAKNQRLSPPEGITWKGTPRTGSFKYAGKSVQNLALEINGWNGIGPGGSMDLSESMGLGDTTAQVDEGAVENMLDRYTSSALINASDYESQVKREMQDDESTVDNSGTLTVNKMYAADKEDFQGDSAATNPLYPEASTTIYNNGGLGMDMQSDPRSAYEAGTRNGGSFMSYSTRGGLSTLSMYNFLNTEFTESGIVTYAPAKSTSIYSKTNPLSVTAVGTGISPTLNLLNAVSQIMVITMLGLIYGLGLMFSQLKHGVAIISSIPATLMGSLHGFAKMLKTVVVMLSSVFFTVIFYFIMVELTMAIGGVFANVLKEVGFYEITNLALIGIVQPIFSIALHIFILWFGVRNRKKFLKGMSEIMEGLADKFINVLDTPIKADGGKSVFEKESQPEMKNRNVSQNIMQGMMAMSAAGRMKDMYDARGGGSDVGKGVGGNEKTTDSSGTRIGNVEASKGSDSTPDNDDHNSTSSSSTEKRRDSSSNTSGPMTDKQAQEEAERLIKGGGITSEKKDDKATPTKKAEGVTPNNQPIAEGIDRSVADINADDTRYDPRNTDVLREEEVKDEARKIRAKGFTNTASGAVKAGVGVAKVAAGDVSGVKSIASGGEQAANGVRTMKDKDGALQEAGHRVETNSTDNRSMGTVIASGAVRGATKGVTEAVTDGASSGNIATYHTEPPAPVRNQQVGKSYSRNKKSATSKEAGKIVTQQTKSSSTVRNQQTGKSYSRNRKTSGAKETQNKMQGYKNSQGSVPRHKSEPVKNAGKPQDVRQSVLQAVPQKDALEKARIHMSDMQAQFSMPAYREKLDRSKNSTDKVQG